MKTSKNGDLTFSAYRRSKKVLEFYKFKKDNYESHCLKHYISGEESLEYIENAIKQSDCITVGKNKNQKNYYLVVNFQKDKKSISVRVYKVICYKNFENNKKIIYRIATVFDWWSPNYNVINPLEEVIWKKPNSLI